MWFLVQSATISLIFVFFLYVWYDKSSFSTMLIVGIIYMQIFNIVSKPLDCDQQCVAAQHPIKQIFFEKMKKKYVRNRDRMGSSLK